MPDDLLKLAAANIDREWVNRHSFELNRLERSTANKDFLSSTDYVLELMREAGFSEIERYALPCDGTTVYDDCIMPQAWDRTGRSTLEIVSPEKELLADSDVEPIHAVIWSPPTPPGGVTAELVSLRSVKSDDWHELAGKIVLWDNSPSPAEKLKVTRSGALGIVAFVDSIYDRTPDDIRWMNGSGLRGWYYTKADPKIWVFSITPRKGRELEQRLAAGEKITVKAVMNTRIYDGKVYTVTGVIPGKSKEEMALLAHMYEPFVPDDAAGTVLSIAAGKALKAMVDQGAIPPLEKSLRVVFTMERYGFSEYFLNPARGGKVISAVNMDSICHATYKMAGIPARLRRSAASAPHFDTVIMGNYFAANYPGLPFEKNPGTLSDDTFMADATYKIPCSWFYTHYVPGCHHNTNAIFDQPDWEVGIAITAAVTAYHAKVNTAMAGVNTQEVVAEIVSGVSADAKEDFKRLAAMECPIYDKSVIGAFLTKFHTGRICFFNRFLPGSVNESEISRKIGELQNTIVPVPCLSSSDVPADPLARMVATRAKGFSQVMSFAKVPLSERYTKLRKPEMLLLALLDGKRSCYDSFIISNFLLELTPRADETEQLARTIKFLAKYGYFNIEGK